MRRATGSQSPSASLCRNFNPRSPCGERRCASPRLDDVTEAFQSTLSLRRATCSPKRWIPFGRFQSTLSLRRATRAYIGFWAKNKNFNPRSPCGERQCSAPGLCRPAQFQSTLSLRRATHLGLTSDTPDRFQSTLSLRRATANPDSQDSLNAFQSTLSLRRATVSVGRSPYPTSNFNPRSPCGERPLWMAG